MMRSWRVRIAPLACLAVLTLAGAQDGGDRQDWKASLTQVNREASQRLQSIAKLGSDAGDWESAQLFLALAYFLENFDPIIRGTWKAPGEGQDKLWDASKNALAKLRESKSLIRTKEPVAVELRNLGSRASDQETPNMPKPSIEVENLNGFDFSIDDRNGEIKIVVRQREGDPATKESLEKRKQALESLKGFMTSQRVKKAIASETERVNGWIKEPKTFPGDPKGTVKPESQPQDTNLDKDTLQAKYMALMDAAKKAGADDVSLSAEILGHLVLYLQDILEGLRTANDYRQTTGLNPVGLTALATYGCMLHSRYLYHETPDSWSTFDAHQESSASPHYTSLGAQAAPRSVIATGTLRHSVHAWMSCFYHRISLLNPALERIGLGRWKTGRVYNTCMDVRTGVGTDAGLTAVPFPGKGSTNVPIRFDGEIPNPLPDGVEDAGYPITLSFFPSLEKTPLDNVNARLLEGQDEVQCWVSTPKNPANKSEPNNRDSICLIPKRILKKGTCYRVEIEASVGTERKSWSWSFTTTK